MSEEFNEFRIAIGALAETLRMFREELLKNGFSRTAAFQLTQAFMHDQLITSQKNKEEN